MAKRVLPGDPKTAIAYLRVSTDRQDLGVDAQRAAIEAWAAREGVTIAGWHIDQGVSGGAELDDRPALVSALADLRVAGAGVLVVLNRSRLARDSGVAIAIERAVKACGARVRSADGVGDGESATDVLVRRIMDAVAEHERALISLRTKAALAAKKARNGRAGTVQFGYRVVAVQGETEVLEPDPEEQAVISTVRTLRAEGVSLRTIVARLEAEGFRSRTGTPLGLTQVARVARAA